MCVPASSQVLVREQSVLEMTKRVRGDACELQKGKNVTVDLNVLTSKRELF